MSQVYVSQISGGISDLILDQSPSQPSESKYFQMYDRWHVSVVQKNLPISPPAAPEGRSSHDAGRTSRAKDPHSLLLPDRSRGQKLIHTGLTLLYYHTRDKSIECPLSCLTLPGIPQFLTYNVLTIETEEHFALLLKLLALLRLQCIKPVLKTFSLWLIISKLRKF